MSDSLSVKPVSSLELARGPWTALAERAGTPFATWEWAAAWWRHFGRDRQLALELLVRGGGEPLAVLPVYLALPRPMRVLRLLGHGVADELAPVCAFHERPQAALALAGALARQRADVLVADDIPELWSPLLPGSVVRRVASPWLPIEGRTWDDYLAGRSRNFREQVRRRERRLADVFDVRYRLCADPDRLDADLDVLFSLHGSRWAGEHSLFGRREQEFHREFAHAALDRGWLRLWVMELDGRAAAAWYGFRFAGSEWYYQAGRDPALDRYSVGLVLLCHTVREAFADGLDSYRFLRGDEAYKDRFAPHQASVETVAIARSLRGRAALAGAAAARRIAPMRTLLARLR